MMNKYQKTVALLEDQVFGLTMLAHPTGETYTILKEMRNELNNILLEIDDFLHAQAK